MERIREWVAMLNPMLVPVDVSGMHLVMELLATRLSSDPLAIMGIMITSRNEVIHHCLW